MLRVLGSVNVVSVRQVRLVSGLLMVAGFVMVGGFVVVVRGTLMMFSCLLVMVGCFL